MGWRCGPLWGRGMADFDTLGRCKNHLWDWYEDDYTTTRYRCCRCGKERGVWKSRVPEFEAPKENGVCNVRTKRPRP